MSKETVFIYKDEGGSWYALPDKPSCEWDYIIPLTVDIDAPPGQCVREVVEGANPYKKPDYNEKAAEDISPSKGWIPWPGGECPVAKGTLVDVKYRDGTERLCCKALVFGDSANNWSHNGHPHDIIEYRLSNAEAAGQPTPAPDYAAAIQDIFDILRHVIAEYTPRENKDRIRAYAMLDAAVQRMRDRKAIF